MLDCAYDAWNRLVVVRDGEHVVGQYDYDGLNRRIAKRFDSHSPQSPRGLDRLEHYYHSRQWQVLERGWRIRRCSVPAYLVAALH